MGKRTLYDLELHEVRTVSEFLSVRRVPGGWLYRTVAKKEGGASFGSISVSLAFVPFDNEFMEKL